MGAKKKEVVEEVVEPVSNVTVYLDRDPNDPRSFPIVDGNTQPVIDINKPA